VLRTAFLHPFLILFLLAGADARRMRIIDDEAVCLMRPVN